MKIPKLSAAKYNVDDSPINDGWIQRIESERVKGIIRRAVAKAKAEREASKPKES